MADVKVYYSPTCPVCAKVKKYLDEKGVEYEQLDVVSDEDARDEMLEKSEQLAVPQIEINGKMIVGFDKNALESELKNV